MILEYYSDASNSRKQGSTSFFDKNLWSKYVDEILEK
jgi:hypothetical protein